MSGLTILVVAFLVAVVGGLSISRFMRPESPNAKMLARVFNALDNTGESPSHAIKNGSQTQAKDPKTLFSI